MNASFTEPNKKALSDLFARILYISEYSKK